LYDSYSACYKKELKRDSLPIFVATTKWCLKYLCNTEAYVGHFTEFTRNNEEPGQTIWHND